MAEGAQPGFPAAVRAVSAEHGLCAGAIATPLARPQVRSHIREVLEHFCTALMHVVNLTHLMELMATFAHKTAYILSESVPI